MWGRSRATVDKHLTCGTTLSGPFNCSSTSFSSNISLSPFLFNLSLSPFPPHPQPFLFSHFSHALTLLFSLQQPSSSIHYSMAAAPPPDQEKLRHDLRVQYKEAALSLVKNLKSESKCFYSHKELDALKVSLGQFDPFSDSKDSLFKPLSTCEFGNFSIDGTTLEGGARLYYFHFDEAIAEIANIKESETLCWEAAHQVFDRLRISYRHYRKKSKSGKTTTYMYESSNWDSMRDSEK